ncbi:AtpZ/AtpI family protein [Halomonas sp. YLGW01]|uniref:AtpZ/AtpI family protein n=1 Tax=Halomonas sp. YLGW01 TaxID=2773308 RepID=UPI00177FE6F9|nr:AtpZ/AtpI family protein [Halomonas sp. YLGW01]
MTDAPRRGGDKDRPSLAEQVGAKAARKLKARRHRSQGVWFGLGMMGLIGWSVVVPTLAGAMIGVWLDKRHPGPPSWTLTLLLIGLVIGCWNAWHWVAKEDRAIHDAQRNGDGAETQADAKAEPQAPADEEEHRHD